MKTDADRRRKGIAGGKSGGWSDFLLTHTSPDSFTMANCCIRFSFSFLNAISTQHNTHVCAFPICMLRLLALLLPLLLLLLLGSHPVSGRCCCCCWWCCCLPASCNIAPSGLRTRDSRPRPSPMQQQLTLFAFTWHFVAIRCSSSLCRILHPILVSHRKLPLIHFPQLLPATWKRGDSWGETTHYHATLPPTRLLS